MGEELRPAIASLDDEIIRAWESLPPARRTVRATLAVLTERGTRTNRDRVAKTLASYKADLRKLVVMEEAQRVRKRAEKDARRLKTMPLPPPEPEEMPAVEERRGAVRSALDALDELLVGLATVTQAAMEGGIKPKTVAEVATLTQAASALVSVLTQARRVQIELERTIEAARDASLVDVTSTGQPASGGGKEATVLAQALRRLRTEESR